MPPFTPNAGDLVGDRYRVEAVLGRGGMGVVARAHDEMLDRTVALKFVDASDAATADRVRSEIRMQSALLSSDLVALFDAHVVPDGDSYLVMEFVDGPSLADALAGHPAEPEMVLAVLRHVAAGLRVLHAKGIVHRDVKPGNILLAPGPVPADPRQPKLADFGIAHLVGSSRMTAAGQVLGTARYLSPEQVRGDEPGPAADVYSLALVLLEALTGASAFPGTGVESAMARLTNDPAIPPDLSADWRALLAAMTARTPGSRPSAADVVAAAADLSAPETTTGTADDDTTEAMPAPTLVLPAAGVGAGVGAGAGGGLSARAAADPTSMLDLEQRDARRRRRVITVVGVCVAAAIVAVGLIASALSAGSGTAHPGTPSPTATSPSVVKSTPLPTPAPKLTTVPGNGGGPKGNHGNGNGHGHGHGGGDSQGDG